MHHARGLCALKVPPETARQLAIDYTEADISEADLAMLGFVAKVTLDPVAITPEDITILKAHGFNDQAAHDIVQVCGYFNYVNRIADALGVELEDYMAQWNQEVLGLAD